MKALIMPVRFLPQNFTEIILEIILDVTLSVFQQTRL